MESVRSVAMTTPIRAFPGEAEMPQSKKPGLMPQAASHGQGAGAST
jgi:hypothetical protein